MRHLRYDRQVVSYEERCRLMLLHDIADSGENLDLSGDIERRGRLVEDDEAWMARHRHGHHGALQLSP